MSLEILKKLAEEDQKDHGYFLNTLAPEQIKSNDLYRIKTVNQLIKDNKLESAGDFHRAALIFQHDPDNKHIIKAMELAQEALDLGQPICLNLASKAYDRLITFDMTLDNIKDKKQRFGTQFFIDKNNRIVPIARDNVIDDLTLKKFGILDSNLYSQKPLSEYLENRTKLIEETLIKWNELEDNDQEELKNIFKNFLIKSK